MAINGKPNGSATDGITNPLPLPIRMTINFDQMTGETTLDNVPQNRLVALGLLDVARHILLAQGQVKQSPLFVVPPGARLG